MVECERRELIDEMPGGVVRELRVDVGRHEAEKRGRELAVIRMASRVAPRAELLEMGELADVDLRRELAPDRAFERLGVGERPARQGPGTAERLARPLPEQRMEPAPAHLEHGREDDLRGGCGRIVSEVSASQSKTLVERP